MTERPDPGWNGDTSDPEYQRLLRHERAELRKGRWWRTDWHGGGWILTGVGLLLLAWLVSSSIDSGRETDYVLCKANLLLDGQVGAGCLRQRDIPAVVAVIGLAGVCALLYGIIRRATYRPSGG